MHYSQCSFSIDCPAGSSCACTNVAITILAPNQAWQPQIGQRTHISRLDQLTMSFLYPQNDWRFVDQTHTGNQQGNFLEPYNTFAAGMQNAPAGSTLQIQPEPMLQPGDTTDPWFCELLWAISRWGSEGTKIHGVLRRRYTKWKPSLSSSLSPHKQKSGEEVVRSQRE
jgi:hypothetical protein